MTPIRIEVVGIPIRQPRTRACIVRAGPMQHASVYDPGDANDWKRLVVMAARDRIPTMICHPVSISETFRFPRPVSHFGTGRKAGQLKTWTTSWCDSKKRGDRDNLDKAVLDALVGGGLLSDDALVVDGRILKRWCRVGEQPGCLIVIADPVEDET